MKIPLPLVLFSALSFSMTVSANPGAPDWQPTPLPTKSWPEEPREAAPAPSEEPAPEPAPAPAPATQVPATQAPVTTGPTLMQSFQPARPHWPAPPAYGQPPQYYPPAYRQFAPRYPTAPVTAAPAPAAPTTRPETPGATELEAARNELAAARQSIEQLSAQLEAQQNREAQLTADAETALVEQKTLRLRIIELTDSLNTARMTLEQQQQMISHYDATNQELDAERTHLLKQLETREVEAQQARELANEARFQARSAGEAMAAARTQVSALRDALHQLAGEMQEWESYLLGTR